MQGKKYYYLYMFLTLKNDGKITTDLAKHFTIDPMRSVTHKNKTKQNKNTSIHLGDSNTKNNLPIIQIIITFFKHG